jgi:hypothetical protein
MVANFSLINPYSDKPHGDNVYNMFILSAILAKESGYTLHLHASQDVIDRIGKWYDVVNPVTNYDFKLYDDLKIRLWGASNQDAFTIDGDVLTFNTFQFNSIETNQLYTLSVEAFDLRPGIDVIHALQVFNYFRPSDVVKEWDYDNVSSYNTGLVRWSGINSDFKRYYIKKYYELRDWFFKNQNEMYKRSNFLKEYSSVASHFICEHLLYQLIKHHKINVDILEKNSINKYKHLKGTNKFRDRDLDHSIKTLLENYLIAKDYEHKNPYWKITIKDLYEKLRKDGKVGNIFNFKN